MVPTGYFDSSGGYLNQSEWSNLWQSALKINYTPIVNVKIVKPKLGVEGDGIAAAVCETLKYSVKPDDLVSDRNWLLGLTEQLHKVRAVAVGGVLKQYLADLEKEPDDLIHVDDDSTSGVELGGGTAMVVVETSGVEPRGGTVTVSVSGHGVLEDSTGGV